MIVAWSRFASCFLEVNLRQLSACNVYTAQAPEYQELFGFGLSVLFDYQFCLTWNRLWYSSDLCNVVIQNIWGMSLITTIFQSTILQSSSADFAEINTCTPSWFANFFYIVLLNQMVKSQKVIARTIVWIGFLCSSLTARLKFDILMWCIHVIIILIIII